jgi:hypothetical protein
MIRAVRPSGVALDLQVIRPDPRVEVDGELICEIDGSALFVKADAALAAIDAEIDRGALTEQAVDDHDVRSYYPTGRELLEDFEDKTREIPADAIPRLSAMTRRVAIRERCRLRRLKRVA